MGTRAIEHRQRGAIYWLAGGSAAPMGEPALSAGERRRLERISHPAKRQRFLRGRALVQFALGEMFGAPLAYKVHKTGALDCEIPGYALGLSHSGPASALAIAPGERLGLDIEAIKERDYMAIAAAHFHPEERQELAAMPRDQALQHFYRLWTLKEAQAKHARTSIFSAWLHRNTLEDLSTADGLKHYQGSYSRYALAICCERQLDLQLVQVSAAASPATVHWHTELAAR